MPDLEPKSFAFCLLICLFGASTPEVWAEASSATVSRTAKVRGIVTDMVGRPIAGAQVTAIQIVKRPHTRDKQVVRTGEDGRFRFSVLPGEMVLVSCQATRAWRTRVSRRWIVPDTELLRYVVRKDTGSDADFTPDRREVLIRGRVVDPQGKPVPNAPVTGLGALKGVRTKSDREGVFEIRHEVLARWAPSWLSMDLYVDVAASKMGVVRRVTFNETWQYEVRLELCPYRIVSGHVTDEDGNAVSGVPVLRRNHYLSLKWQPFTNTDENGHFKADDLIPGVCYSFCALSETHGTPIRGHVYWTDEKASIPPIKVLRKDGFIEGVAVRADGTAIPGVSVRAEVCLGERSEVETNEGGRFRITGLVAGEVQVWGRKPEPNVIGRLLVGSVKCSSGSKNVRLVLKPRGCLW